MCRDDKRELQKCKPQSGSPEEDEGQATGPGRGNENLLNLVDRKPLGSQEIS